MEPTDKTIEKISQGTKLRRELFDWMEKVIYSTRVILIPFCLCMFVVLLTYAFKICQATFVIIQDLLSTKGIEEGELLIRSLGLVDMVMIAVLIIMILIGSYSIFVRKINEGSPERRPQWLDHISSGSLKVKISMSIIGVSSIHLLKVFIEAETISFKSLFVKLSIHAFFIVSAIVMAKTNKIIEPHTSEEHV